MSRTLSPPYLGWVVLAQVAKHTACLLAPLAMLQVAHGACNCRTVGGLAPELPNDRVLGHFVIL